MDLSRKEATASKRGALCGSPKNEKGVRAVCAAAGRPPHPEPRLTRFVLATSRRLTAAAHFWQWSSFLPLSVVCSAQEASWCLKLREARGDRCVGLVAPHLAHFG